MSIQVKLTREAFEASATNWCDAGNQAQGWACKREGYTGHVYLERLGKPIKLCAKPDYAEPASWDENEMAEAPDEASIFNPDRHMVPLTGLADLYVSWSPVFQVPVMYFRVRNAAGSALSLDEVLKSSLFHASASELFARDTPLTSSTSQEDVDVKNNAAHFPAISQGEHPSTVTPCFFLHPCETSAALSDILGNSLSPIMPLAILKCWFMIVGSVLDIR